MTEVPDKQQSKEGKMNYPYNTTTSSAKSKGYENQATSETDVQRLAEHVKTGLGLSPIPKFLFDITNRLQSLAKMSAKTNVKQSTKSLEKEMQFEPTPLVKIIQYDIDARQLFGDTPLYSKEVKLRTAEQIKEGSPIELPQFDPNFFSPNQVHCRSPGCHERKVRNRNKEVNKEDLYLCSRHRHEMVDLVTKKCTEKKITVHFKDIENDDLNGYTSLIGLMEKQFQQFEEKASSSSSAQLDRSLAEIFLNIRNFLIITNAVLNPDLENLRCAFAPVYAILQSLLEQLNNHEFVDNLRELLREVMQIILTFFGVIYNWVYAVVRQNPGSEIGAGLGTAAGAIAMGAAFGPAGPLIALGAGIGLLSGGLLGGGLFNLYQPNNHQQNNVFEFIGFLDGGLNMNFRNLRLL